ncbi:carboxymuconolactone decarboxylase family protein [Stackebrandtia soli]|uniref:carboxymuconolactone decarboxylase family protein n=1 Tax=Stackebrandtia soli TaxID=1892856 RepID=UPI0039EBEF91
MDNTTTLRLNLATVAKDAFSALLRYDKAATAGVDETLADLVKIRASQINGCGYCLDMHSTEALKNGVPQKRLNVLAGWRETAGVFTDAELAALELTEEVTLVSQGGVPDDVFAEAAKHFTDEELGALLHLIFVINTWNRIAIATGKHATP